MTENEFKVLIMSAVGRLATISRILDRKPGVNFIESYEKVFNLIMDDLDASEFQEYTIERFDRMLAQRKAFKEGEPSVSD